MTIATLNIIHYDALIRTALKEDLPYGSDITGSVCNLSDIQTSVSLISREDGIVAGLDCALHVFKILDPQIDITKKVNDGDTVYKNNILATLSGSAQTILQGERVALNILSHLSGIATLTHSYVRTISHTHARIAGTRKTLPGLRNLQKYAIQCGGGLPHRYGLNDAIMIKDNHIAMLGGDVKTALHQAYTHKPHTQTIEIEVDTLDQLKDVLSTDYADIVLLDNMDATKLTKAVAMIDGKIIAEASGGINIDTVADIAETGVDIISVGALTHSAPALDIGVDFIKQN